MIKNQALIKNNRSLLLLSLLMGIAAAALAVVYLQQSSDDGSTTGSAAGVPVVVARQEIPAGVTVTPAMVEVKTVPEAVVALGAFTGANDVVGQVTQVAVAKGEQVLPSKLTGNGRGLAEFGDNPPLALVVPQGMRAVSVKVDEVSAVGGLVRPGDYVDVIMVEEVTSGDATVVQSCYAIQNVRVLAVAQDVATSAVAGAQGTVLAGAGSSDTTPDAKTATLAVAPEQAPLLGKAAQRSVDQKLLLVLRPFGDSQPANVAQCAL